MAPANECSSSSSSSRSNLKSSHLDVQIASKRRSRRNALTRAQSEGPGIAVTKTLPTRSSTHTPPENGIGSSRFVYRPTVTTYYSTDGEQRRKTTRPLTASGRPSHSRRPEPGHVKRPRNAYIMFRCDLAEKGLVADVKLQSDFSKIAAQMWRDLPAQEKKQYHDRWEKEKREHELLHPEYRYSPQQRSKGKATSSTSAKPRVKLLGPPSTTKSKRSRSSTLTTTCSAAEEDPHGEEGLDGDGSDEGQQFTFENGFEFEETPWSVQPSLLNRRASSAPPAPDFLSFVSSSNLPPVTEDHTFAFDPLNLEPDPIHTWASGANVRAPVTTSSSTSQENVDPKVTFGPSLPLAPPFSFVTDITSAATADLAPQTSIQSSPMLTLPSTESMESISVPALNDATTSSFQGDLMLVSPFDTFDRKSSLGRFFPSSTSIPQPINAPSTSLQQAEAAIIPTTVAFPGARRESRAALLKNDNLPDEVLQALAGAAAPFLPANQEATLGQSPASFVDGRRASVSVGGHGELGLVSFPQTFLEGIPEEQTFDWALSKDVSHTSSAPATTSPEATAAYGITAPQVTSSQGLPNTGGGIAESIAASASYRFPPQHAEATYGLYEAPSDPAGVDPGYRFPPLPPSLSPAPPLTELSPPAIEAPRPYRQNIGMPQILSLDGADPGPSTPPPVPLVEGNGARQPGTYVFLNREQAKDDRLIEYLLGEGIGVTFRAEDCPPGVRSS